MTCRSHPRVPMLCHRTSDSTNASSSPALDSMNPACHKDIPTSSLPSRISTYDQNHHHGPLPPVPPFHCLYYPPKIHRNSWPHLQTKCCTCQYSHLPCSLHVPIPSYCASTLLIEPSNKCHPYFEVRQGSSMTKFQFQHTEPSFNILLVCFLVLCNDKSKFCMRIGL